MEFTTNAIYLIAVLAFVLFVSEWLVKKPFFNKFGIALMVIILTAVLANVGLVPTTSNPVYDGIFSYVAPGALFLLLLDVNLSQLKKVGFPILFAFILGSLGTVLGVLAATLIVKDNSYFDGVYNALAGMIAGTYTGGSINFNAVALHYKVVEKGVIYTNAVAVDNVITTVWFFLTIAIPVAFQKIMPRSVSNNGSETVQDDGKPPVDEQETLNLKSLSLLIGISCFAMFISDAAAGFFQEQGIVIPSILILTTIALIAAQVPAISKLKGNMLLGSWAVYLFLAVVGAYCDFAALGQSGALSVALLIFVSVTVLIHGLFTYGAGFFTKYDWQLISVASQANIGGGTTALALAKNFNRNELILPSIIIGSIGNALGTYIGFLVAGYI
ncbi:DUF819 family protein [Leptobacterium flavescens]|uniref:DUF819 family protein n=1 Tax=Leptobacterium flavescens TaxID=472055 RepID=A0A6P0UMJ0_9FLAO|nr:DUF819 family protein [Leptobacterium flavescens]NER13670.1 DUF819 family protein [Leptobacterium flavescens]